MRLIKTLQLVTISLVVTDASAATFARTALGDCLAAAKVPYQASSNSTWSPEISYNNRVVYTPAAIATPTTTKHIQSAVSCGAKLGVKVSAKGGGHSYAFFGVGGESGHLVLNMEYMNNVTLDSSSSIATVGPGARLGHVATQLFEQGGRAISHGTCPGVGISGHVLHGGYGMASRSRGLTLDWLESADVVLANASVVTCSATSHPDLFWGIRGAGSNFGIISSFRFRTFEPPSVATGFEIRLNWTTKSQMAEGLEALRRFGEDSNPSELTLRLQVGAFGSRAAPSLQGAYYGSAADLNRTLAPLLTSIGGTYKSQAMGGWIDSLNFWANKVALDQTYPYTSHENFYATSVAVKNFTGTSLSNFVDYWSDVALAEPTSHQWFFQLDLVGGKDAAVPAISNNATAYAHRDKNILIQWYDKASPVDFSFMGKWAKNTVAPLAASDWGSYINYADSQFDKETAQQLYYGTNLARLQQLKAKYDPEQLFDYTQALLPAS